MDTPETPTYSVDHAKHLIGFRSPDTMIVMDRDRRRANERLRIKMGGSIAAAATFGGFVHCHRPGWTKVLSLAIDGIA